MNSAVLFLKNQKEQDLARISLFDKHLIDYTIIELKRLDVDTIYLVGDNDFSYENVIKRDSIDEVINELKNINGKCLLLSPFYPLVDKSEYERLLRVNGNGVFIDKNGEIVPIFSINSKNIADYEKLDYSGITINETKGYKFTSVNDVSKFQDVIKAKINRRWINKGVIISDPKNTIIGVDVVVDKGTKIYPNVVLEGKCLIGQNNVIVSGSKLKNVVLGDNNYIEDSFICDSLIHNNVKIGTHCNITDNSEIFDEVEIGSSVKLTTTKVGQKTIIEHLTYLGDCQVGEEVKVGSGVVTVNSDGMSRNTSIIKSHSVIGSNVSIISPVTIGEYTLIAAGSTIDQDVKDGDMAIARLYQQNKKGYGYKYIKED